MLFPLSLPSQSWQPLILGKIEGTIMEISGPAALALNTLSPSQVQFLRLIPKAELHAHLNGSIPITTLNELAAEYLSTSD
jgi:hypothetical protein